MKSIRRRINTNNKKVIIGLFVAVFLATFCYVRFVNPLFTRAEALYMAATITDDGGDVDFSPGIDDAVAKFSFQHTGTDGANSKIYNAKISLHNMPSDIKKKLKVTLPVGMYWQDDGSNDTNLASQLDSAQGTNGIEKIPVAAEPILGYDYPNSGSRVYYFASGSVALAINIKIKVDSVIDIGYIEDAIKAEFIVDDTVVETAHVDVDVPDNVDMGGKYYITSRHLYVKAGETYQTNQGYYRLMRSSLVIGQYDVKKLIKNTVISYHVSDPALKIILKNPSDVYSIDDSGAETGDYTITYTPTAAVNGSITIPYAYIIPEGVADGTTYTITSTAKTTFYEADGSERTVDFNNSQTITLEVLPNEGLVTIGWSSLNPSNPETAHDNNFYATMPAEPYAQGTLGYFYANNKGSVDSEFLRAKITFDTDVLGVMALEVGCGPGTTIETLHIKTTSGIEKDVEYNKTCNDYGYATQVTYGDMGLDRFDYVKEVEYDFGVIPAGHQISQAAHDAYALSYVGRLLDETTSGVATFELYEKDNPEHTTGVAKVTTKYTTNGGTLDLTNLATQIKNAGESLNFAVNVTNWAGGTKYNNTVKAPVIYIRQQIKDAAGNFLPISNLKITNGAARGNEDITSYFGEISYEDTADARVYKIDASSVPDGKASLCATYISESGTWYNNIGISLSWSVDTDMTTPDQHYNIADMVFVSDPNRTSNITTHYNRGDPFGLTGTPYNTVYAATTNYYQIRGWASIGVENAGKHTASDEWLTWTDGSNPITIGTTEGSLADMKATMINSSGVEVPGPTTMYFPIPKKDENWGTLNYDGQAFEFSTALTGAISNPDSSHFTIAYGKNVTPTDNGSSLDSENAKFTTDTSTWTTADWEAANCIKITASNIPANAPGTADNYDFVYQLKVTDVANATDGAVNTWRPIYYQQLTNSAGDIFAGWYKGSYVSVKLADGSISGQLFVDANENGKKDVGESDLKEAGWKIDLYDRSSNRLVRSTETDINGKYNIVEVGLGADSYYITITNKHPIDGTANPRYLFTPKGEASNSGTYNTDNQAVGSKTSTPAHATAYIGPITASQTANEATYNIGVIEYVATENYAGQVTFNDQNNLYNTRPATVTITATANDGSTQTISVATNGEGVFSADLPKYNNQGDRLTYSFSAPDYTNYNKTDQTSPDGYTYVVTYTQKTATLTVNHFKKGTAEPLAATQTSTVYWGQTYATAQATVDSYYEYDSILGSASGPVAGDVTVTYYYKLKRGVVTAHHYVSGTETMVSADVSEEYDYGTIYNTYPLATMPAAYRNYEVVSAQPTGYTGTVKAPLTEVTYYYQKKDPQLTSNINITAPEMVDNKTATIPYSITYTAQLKDYIGGTTLTIVQKLPYPINEDESDFGDGVYNASAKTITWTVSRTLNTYTDGESINFEKNVELVFEGAAPRDNLLSTAEAKLTLDDRENVATDNIETEVLTKSQISFEYTGPDGEPILPVNSEEGIVGDQSPTRPPHIPGYILIEEEVDYTFEEEDRVIIFRYIKNPQTFDSILIAVACGLMALVGCFCVYRFIVRRR